MQNAGIATLALNWRYLAFEVYPEDLRSAIAGAQVMNYIGLNLTVPHKLLAMDIVDELDETATTWGAVNTIQFEGKTTMGEWRPLREFTDPPRETRARGFNTDAEAITRSLQEDLGMNLQGASVLLLGAGGAGRTAALKLAAEKVARLFIVNRTPNKAEEIGSEIRRRHPEVKVALAYPAEPVDLMLNATSVGLKAADALPFDETQFSLRKVSAVYDMVYDPAETPLCKAAKSFGCRVSNGLGMLLYQGAKALEIWTGCPAPVQEMRRALEKKVYGS